MKANLLTQVSLSLALALCLLLGQTQLPITEGLVLAQSEVWTTYTNGNYVNDLALEGNYLWAATEGGVVRWDVRDGTYIKYTQDDGLVNNDVQAVAVDLDGNKWFGTSGGGVSYFDGTIWTTYDASNSGLASNYVRAIAIDKNGSKWFGTNYNGISRFDGTTWTTYNTSNSGLADSDIRAITIDRDGSKWFGTDGGGVSHFDGTTWTTYNTSNSGLVNNTVFAIASDLDGGKWFGTWCGGVSHFDGTTWTTYTSSNSGLAFNCVGEIAIDNNGGKWFSIGEQGVSHFNGSTWTTYNTSNSGLVSNSITAIATDNNSGKWFGGFDLTRQGISKFDGSTWTTFATTDGLVHNEVQAIAADRSGGKWFGTNEGVSWLVGSFWVNYTTSNSKLRHNEVRAIAIDNDDTVWFGTWCGGVSHFDGTTWTTYDTFNSNLASPCVGAISIDSNGDKWFGTGLGGVSHFDGTTWTTYNTSNSGLASNYVQAIAIDNNDDKWFGTLSSGVSRFDGTNWTTYNTSNSGLINNNVLVIVVDRDGSKWFGTNGGGVSRFDGTTWTTYNTSNSGLASNWITAIAIDKNGSKWFSAYGGGVSRFDGTTWTTYNTSNSGLASNYVQAMAIDNNGNKWFGFDLWTGLSRFGPPPATETYVRVVDEDGDPLPGAKVYRNGIPLADANDVAYTTNVIGVLMVSGLTPADRLVALAPQYKQPTIRAAHGPPGRSWAFQVNVTNAPLDNQGNIHIIQAYNPASGEYLLTTARDNTLVTFNLVVSIEWNATDEYITEITQAVQHASDYLYDLTDGQMAFGQVAIYDGGHYWADADIQISTNNIVRPHAYIGGLTSADKAQVIRVGRGWNGYSGDQGPWNQPAGYRTLAHEFGHYALYLYDEYFAYVFDQNGKLVGETPAICIGPQNRNPATDATNASAMDYQYTSSELSAREVAGLWSPLCEQTAQWQLNPTADIYSDPGESAWETLARKYSDTTNPPNWQLITPARRGGILAGPNGLPDEILALPTVQNNSNVSGQSRDLTVYGSDGHGYWGAIVALYKKRDGRVIGQGFTNGNGQLKIYGVEAEDTVRAASFDGGLHGSVTIGAEERLSLTLTPIGELAIQASGIPHLRVLAQPSQNPAQIDLLISLQNFGAGADPSVIITRPGSEAGYAPTLSYSPVSGAYEGAISFSATERGMGRIRAVGVLGNSVVRLQSTYRLQGVVNSQGQDIFSDDGNLSLHLEPGSLPGNQAYFVVMPPGAVPGSLPAGLVLVGNAYDVAASGSLVALAKPAVLSLRYDGVLVNPTETPAGLGIYHWNPSSQAWQAVLSQLDEEHKTVVASVMSLGTHALLAPPGLWNEPSYPIFLPIIVK